MEKSENIVLPDRLAIERTKLSNERTLLSYFRTSFMFLATGLTFLKVDYFSDIHWIGWIFVALFPLSLTLGIIRYIQFKKELQNLYESLK